MQDFTLHTHTVGFDGRDTAAQMIQAARTRGFRAIGISNHFIVHPSIKRSLMFKPAYLRSYDAIYSSDFDEVIARFKPHYRELRKLADKYDIRVLCGAEVDYFHDDKWRRGFESALKVLRPDYLIGSAHFVMHDNMLCNTHDMKRAMPATQDYMVCQYWRNVQNAAHSGLFTWMAHLDLPRKVGLNSGINPLWADCERETVAALAKTGARIEVNTSPMKTLGEPYPAAHLLKQIAARNIPVLLSDDAHRASDIGQNFDAAYQFAQKCGVTRFVGLSDLIKSR